jgi:ATP-dependent exoDNAse (exonuclease V) beta subunit
VMSPLSAFLAHASLEAGDAQAQAGQEAIQLMTVHSAKGLEFDAVFITGLEEGLFPHESSAREMDGVDEERRLMYVAITRARRRLYMSFTQQRMLHGQTRFNMKSRFFDELPEHALKWLTPRVQTSWFAGRKSTTAWDDAAFREGGSDNQIDLRQRHRLAHRRIGESRALRRGRDRQHRGRGRQRARADQFWRGGDEGARPVGGQARKDRSITGRWAGTPCPRVTPTHRERHAWAEAAHPTDDHAGCGAFSIGLPKMVR